MEKENITSGLQNVFDNLFKEAETEYNKMPDEYCKRVSLSEHQENYIREKANEKLKRK